VKNIKTLLLVGLFSLILISLSACKSWVSGTNNGGQNTPLNLKVAEPVLQPSSGVVESGTAITITTVTSGAQIYYILANSAQNIDQETGILYNPRHPPIINAKLTITVIAVKEGYQDSSVVTAAYTLASQVITPVITPPSGVVIKGTEITVSTDTPNSLIYYTMDGNDPVCSGTLYDINNKPKIDGPLTVKAIACNEDYDPSEIAIANYTLLPKTVTPIFTPSAGVVARGTQIGISSLTAGALIYYTTDGSEPTQLSTLYAADNKPIIEDTTTIKAKAFKDGLDSSNTSTATYTLLPKAATPVITPSTGSVPIGSEISISSSTPGSLIYYTLDGTEPSESSLLYDDGNKPVVEETTVIKAKAFASGFDRSDTATASYTLLPRAQTPTFLPESGPVARGTIVSINSESGAVIYYTIGTNGSIPANPDQSSGSLYDPTQKPVIDTDAMTIKAIAYKTGTDPSNISTASYTLLPLVADPVFSPVSGAVARGTAISISTETSGANIYYTIDGTDPTQSSTQYTAPIVINSDTTFKAKAFKAGSDPSAIITSSYTMLSLVSTPVFSPISGAVARGTAVTISTNTNGAAIYYTTDGTDPTQSSSQYTTPIVISSDTNFKAKAFKTGDDPSTIATASYTMLPLAAAPVFSPLAGSVARGTAITISTTTNSAAIYYTTDGTDPTQSSTQYTAPITISVDTAFKAKTFKDGYDPSTITSASYTMLPLVAAPTFSPTAGYVPRGTAITISTTTSGATVYYTTDGTDPTQSSSQYTAPIVISSDTTFKAKAFKTGDDPSTIATASYTMLPLAATPTFSPGTGFYGRGTQVTISSNTSGASVYYTTDGTEPDKVIGTLYTGPITINADTTIKAKAYSDPLYDPSDTGSASYTMYALASDPTFSPVAGAITSGTGVTLSTTTTGATIYYTIDGSDPTQSSTQYTTPIIITTATTIKAKAFASGFDPSNTSTASYTISSYIFVGGGFTSFSGTSITRIAKIKSDGTLDTSFNPGTGADNQVYYIYPKSDGKILVTGDFITYNGVTKNRLVQLNSDGSIDNSFDIGTGFNGNTRSAMVLPSGKVMVDGTFTNYQGLNYKFILRLNSNGSLDTTFNSLGSAGAGGGGIYSMAIQNDGKIIVGGAFTSYSTYTRNRIARLNTDGSVDTSFDAGTGFNNIVYSLAIQSDGKILAGGVFTNYDGTHSYLARLNSNGTFDSSFNSSGSGVLGTGPAIYSIAIQSNNKIVIAGMMGTYNGVSRPNLARVNSDGTLDTGFVVGTGANNTVNSAVLQSDGKVLIGGYFSLYNGTSRSRMARLNSDGSVDTSFLQNAGNGFDNYVKIITAN